MDEAGELFRRARVKLPVTPRSTVPDPQTDPPLDPLPHGAKTGEERRIVAAARRGDRRAFACLVERYGPMVMSLAYASTLDIGEAEDVCQETFLAAWRALPTFRQDAQVSSWLYQLARSRCVDRARRLAARPSTAPLELTDASVSEARTPDAMAVMRAARDLPLNQRQAVLMRDIQGLSYEEISLAQDVPVGTVRSRISIGRAAIAESIRETGS